MTPTEQYNAELYHYGVKGQKWGVRRNIGVKARAAAQYKKFAESATRNVKRLEERKAKKGLTDREVDRLKKNQDLARNYTKSRNALIKNMSDKDIKRGERAITRRYILGGAINSAAMNLSDLAKANALLERERNR